MSRRLVVSGVAFAASSVFAALSAQPGRTQAVPSVVRQPVLTTLHTFTGPDGETPECTLALGPDGAFYGTTMRGGKGYGTVFKITPDGRFTQLALFDYWNGSLPGSLLFDAKSGGFYGASEGGGANGTGTVFRVAPDGGIAVLHSFGAKPAGKDHVNDGGADPFSGPILGKEGALYGTVRNGGRYGGGCLYKLTTDGTYTLLHDFKPRDGQHPESRPYQSSDGSFYGTAFDGGENGYGTVYRISPDARLKVLHSFRLDDGVYPDTALTAQPDGALQGATRGGRAVGRRIAYRITTRGDFHRVDPNGSEDPSPPAFAPVAGPDGNFYGTTFHWTAEDGGCLYRVTPQCQATTLYRFHAGRGGYGPCGEAVFGPDGALYGTTYDGGLDVQGANTGRGTIYRLSLTPPITPPSTPKAS